MALGNVLTAMVTPFDFKGNIDFKKMNRLMDYLIENGTEGVIVGGTTGESATLSMEEKSALYEHAVKAAAGRIPVIAGTGMNDTYATAELTVKAEKLGVDGIMLVSPYYNKPSQRGLYEHFKTIAEKTSLPVMLYNIPGRCVVNLLPETVVALSKIHNITSIKEASGDLDQMTTIISETPKEFQVFSGDDSLTLPSMAVGADGIVSVSSHIVGNDMQHMIKAFKSGDIATASAIHQKLLPIMKSLFIAPNPSPVKTALQIKGLDVGGVRLPLLPVTPEERLVIQHALS
ncbi:4-hydroxy-tetrahydrodipicolinate synthase [Salipaludibacillus agaradhaerens]|jgi:4-hydroxy-tetrahydrodipicolinate synthase|uniref:4-hydroxy-tetrahydrodipicolinate synthase n=1 Tax=Salipaludibacillus agaradhaerens TaxID=76935 RepID=A0A9Q4B157_SALAG|nr:4-hydroxy-tetrahydrodipicolinate synthase [Salipaludibacillus agaradhaerens]UJW58097.1 4-hydroxy-tetrahydrodipicolinate synthase [Bacillus sp. A116_S68]MCR6096100.1 4-hydroxy-tetrahydrodipicolinate synthase [Salipaludibacillus agaradhaerens]MCR6107012.1 4-hydroxy-tetrahydrodipicolinate synthase [Salipaludibacillus agaradhaerens]MCR6114341.1 4-hydroxy-tetrahydrodipicolinate synthase [Salipaludibacillus agaradhaerens]MCR6119043.1 4-hydroxy-tetrahydrodipicolinate synthase [Salipaludibacillus a